MIELLVLFTSLALASAYVVAKVMRRERRRRRAGDSNGLLIEQERTAQLRHDRVTYTSNAVHNNPFTTGL